MVSNSTEADPQSPTGNPKVITGTPLFAAIDVLKGGPHTLSSDFQSLFFSVAYICSKGKVPSLKGITNGASLKVLAEARLGSMMLRTPDWLSVIKGTYREFVAELHHVFFQPVEGGGILHNTSVGADQVLAVCVKYGANNV